MLAALPTLFSFQGVLQPGEQSKFVSLQAPHRCGPYMYHPLQAHVPLNSILVHPTGQMGWVQVAGADIFCEMHQKVQLGAASEQSPPIVQRSSCKFHVQSQHQLAHSHTLFVLTRRHEHRRAMQKRSPIVGCPHQLQGLMIANIGQSKNT